MKSLIRLAIGVLIVFFVLAFAKDMMVKAAVEWGTERATGLQLHMGRLDINLFKTFVGIEDLRLFNPRRYPDKIMVDTPEIFVDYDFPAVFQRKVHLEELRLHLKEFVVVKNEKGELNLDSLKTVQNQKKKEAGVPAKQEAKLMRIQIDRLQLQIEKVVFKDYYNNGIPSVTPTVKEYKLNLRERYENITDMNVLVSLIVVKALANTTIANLTHFDLGMLNGPISGILGSSTKIVVYAGNQAGGALEEVTGDKEIQQELKGAAKKSVQTVKGLFGDLKKSFQ